MPHCLIEGSQSLTQLIAPAELLGVVEDAAAATGLFLPGEVKLRLSLCEYFSVGGSQEDFVHLIFYILAGRTDEQKRLLSRQIVRALVERLRAEGWTPGVASRGHGRIDEATPRWVESSSEDAQVVGRPRGARAPGEIAASTETTSRQSAVPPRPPPPRRRTSWLS